jgi:hypothetical protein
VREQLRTSGGAGLIELEAAAAARWELGGKRAVLLRRRALATEEAAAARLTAQAAAFKSYMAQGGTAAAGLSGRLLQPIGDAVCVDVGVRGRGKRRACSQGSRAHAPLSEFQQGAAPNRYGQWLVDRVLEVRRVRCTRQQAGATNALMMRIRWHGLDPARGLPWRDSWRPLFDEAGCTVSPGLRADVDALAAIKYGAKAPRRAAGQSKAATDTARAAPRWTRSPVRMRRRAAADVQAAPSTEADAEAVVIHTCRVPHVMFQRRVLRDVAGDDGAAVSADARPAERRAAQAASDAAFLALPRDEYEDDGAGLFGDWPTRRAAALRRWAPEEAPYAGPSAVGVADEADSCEDWCAHYDSELDGSCDGLGWSDDEELAAALAEQYA